MPTNEIRRDLLNRAKASGYPGSITEVFQASDQGIDLIEQHQIQQQQQQMQEQQLEAAQMAAEAESLENEKDRQKDIEIALINAESKKDVEGNNLNLEKMIREFEIKERELDLREQELSAKTRGDQASEGIARDANQVKREDTKTKKEIAAKNANKRD